MAFQGQIIDGKYEILREIGRGGMSVVYLAMDKRLNKQWAIKEFRKDKDDESRRIALESLLKEANLMKKLDHPTLPRIVDIIDDSKTVYIVMDYIEGESLNKVLDAYGAQPQETVIEWAKQLSEVLDYLHTRVPPVIYRDMKPANIMLKPDGTIRLIDFGIAREYKKGKAGDTTSIGTRGYAAPEQFGDKGQTDARTDIYSLGVTLYHLVTGKNPAEPPYEIYPIRHWNANLSSGLEWLIQKCTQLNPNDRFQSCAEVTYVLENLEKFESAYKSKQKKKINLFITSVALTLVFGIIGGTTLFLGNKDHDEQIKYYESLDSISGYEQAIDYDNNYTRSYLKLAEKISNQVRVILPGRADSNDEEQKANDGGTFYQEQINKYFGADKMENLKKNDIESYAKVNYQIGKLYWNCYKDSMSDDSDVGSFNAAKEAGPYFKRVIDSAYNVTNHCGLKDTEYNLANYYYLLSFFREKEYGMKNSEDGSFEINDTVKNTIIYDSLKEKLDKDTYNGYWYVNMQMILNLQNDDVRDPVKLNTLKIVVNTVERNLEKFMRSGTQKLIAAEETETFFNTAVDNYEQLKGNNESDNNDEQIKERLDQTKKALIMLREDLINLYQKEEMSIDLADIE